MSWFSLLPAGYTALETWAIRIFLILAALTIGPWALFVTYDILLYIWRSLVYEVPVIGGRARGKGRPRARTGMGEVVVEGVKGLASGVEEVIEEVGEGLKGRGGKENGVS